MSSTYNISRLTLGTAQLGFNYGIANKEGTLDDIRANEILRTSFENSITCFDTAPQYGESERIIGDFFSPIDKSKITVVTKLPGVVTPAKLTYNALYKQIKNQVLSSLKRLRIDKIQIYLLHQPSDMTALNGQVIDVLLELRDEGFVESIGISVYTPEEVQTALDIEELNAIQLPFNIFDLRLLESDLLNELKKTSFTIFARSIFLQGMFFLDFNNLPNGLEIAEKPLKLLHDISLSERFSIKELALLFVRDQPGITSQVVGAETPTQVLENLKIITENDSLSSNLRNEIMNSFSEMPESLIDPRLWKITK